ncbi:MAG TPA: M14 family metallopeptidase [Polyangia bacterium]|jgi:hypothetical protein|nr:M14 family metallopeptidase [Polyangia bacterium]
MHLRLVGIFLCLPLLTEAARPRPELLTTAEQSGFHRTGRYDEVERLCAVLARTYPDRVRCTTLGPTPEGRPLRALIASADGSFAPRPDRPAVVVQGGIHAGEIDGKDAGFQVLRELLEGSLLPGQDILRRLTLVFVPVFNVDGHERYGAHNRPNQNGPEEMGWRTTAQNLNLNRDYMKAEAPEMAAMLKLLGEWDPVVYVDLHVTDGADFQPDVAVLIEPGQAGPDMLAETAREIRAALGPQLAAKGHLPLTEFYPSFVKPDDPAGGFAVGFLPPRFSTSYWALRNRLGVLVETHSWKDYATRVRATHDTMAEVLRVAAERGGAWRQAETAADALPLGSAPVVLAWETAPTSHMIEFRGYAYRREPSPISGQLRIVYDRSRPEIWRVPLYDQLRPTLTVTAPRGGYLVPAAWAARVREKLALHGVTFQTLESAGMREVEVFRATEVSHRKDSFEGRVPTTVRGAWARERRSVPAGSLFVPVAQPRGRLAVHLLEPQAPDSLCSWGYFDAAFEQKEYMEDYVAEAVAEDLLRRDPALKAAFLQKLATEPEFARDPRRRLEFFARRHPSWDERLNLYPVYRVEAAP